MRNPYRLIFERLAEEGIRYLVVGGIAVNLHGYSRYTGDIDILLALDTGNLEKMTEVMMQLGFIERLPVRLKELSDETKVRQWLKEKNMTAYTFIHKDLPQFSIDVIVDASLDFGLFDASRELKRSWGVSIPVISIDDLIGMKRKANREKDIRDIDALLELKGL